MNKKPYTSPSLRVFLVAPSDIICTSDGLYSTLSLPGADDPTDPSAYEDGYGRY